MAMENDPNVTELSEGWRIIRLFDKSGSYYRVTGPEGQSSTTEDFYFAHVHAKRLGWQG